MLDLDFIRKNPELVAEQSRRKGCAVDIPALLDADAQRRMLIGRIEEIRRRRNENSAQIKKGGKPSPELIAEGKAIKEQLAESEANLPAAEETLDKFLRAVPNMPLAHVPVGSSEEENVVVKTWGNPRTFTFTPKSHWQIAEQRGLIDKARAAKVTGARFAYLKGDLVRLQFAIMQWVVDALGRQEILERIISDNKLSLPPTPFVPILPPAMIRTEVFEAMDRLEPRTERYRVGEEEDGLWLQGSAEHTLGSMYIGETLPLEQLPIRYLGYSSSFRREAGSYSKDLEGIIRMHQFDKLEMEIFSSAATGLEEHKLLIAIQEYLVQQLELPYELLQKCTYDIGKPNACGVDINVWMPGQNKFRETHTADYMTDYQSRRLDTRYREVDGKLGYVHTNDATAFALGRTMVAIIENYQTETGEIVIPKVLVPWMGGKTII
jgi:seryl-tRNA synthetase